MHTNNRTLATLAALCLAAVASAQTQKVSVVEYHPAPGQFVNTTPAAAEGDTHDDLCRACEEQLADGNPVSLGALGGYITIAFDHAVQNGRGSDLRIEGNAFYSTADPVYGAQTIGGSIEPGIVYVGVGSTPATARWYELAGSEYRTSERRGCRMTYRKPSAERGDHVLPYSSYDEYVAWTLSWTAADGTPRDSTGFLMKNVYHTQSYWPSWESGEEIAFDCALLPERAVCYDTGETPYWVLYRYAADAYGYADASRGDEDWATFDLDWAVEADGTPAGLDHCDFVRVATGTLGQHGWIGETSTEVCRFTDLHLVEGYDDHPVIIARRDDPSAIVPVRAGSGRDAAWYTLTGQRVSRPVRGAVYIHGGRKVVY